MKTLATILVSTLLMLGACQTNENVEVRTIVGIDSTTNEVEDIMNPGTFIPYYDTIYLVVNGVAMHRDTVGQVFTPEREKLIDSMIHVYGDRAKTF